MRKTKHRTVENNLKSMMAVIVIEIIAIIDIKSNEEGKAFRILSEIFTNVLVNGYNLLALPSKNIKENGNTELSCSEACVVYYAFKNLKTITVHCSVYI